MVWSVYSILNFSGPRQVPGLGRIQNARKAGPWAEFVYSNFPGPGRFLIDSVYSKLEKPGPGRNLYTQIFRVQAGSCSGAYTESSKSRAQGRICILKFSGPGQALVLGRIQQARKSRAPGQELYTQIFRARAGSWSGAYTESLKSRALGRISILRFSGSGQVPGPGRIQKLEKLSPGHNLYTQIFRALAGSCSWAYTASSKSQGPGQNLYTQIFRALAGSWLMAYTESSKS